MLIDCKNVNITYEYIIMLKYAVPAAMSVMQYNRATQTYSNPNQMSEEIICAKITLQNRKHLSNTPI